MDHVSFSNREIEYIYSNTNELKNIVEEFFENNFNKKMKASSTCSSIFKNAIGDVYQEIKNVNKKDYSLETVSKSSERINKIYQSIKEYPISYKIPRKNKIFN